MSKVSIVIPCYNHNEQVLHAIGSALNQTHEDVEVIVVDDGSRVPLDVKGSRLSLIRHSENRGLCPALNTGLAASTGDFITILAADDLLDPQFCEKTLHARSQVGTDPDIVSVDMAAGGMRTHIRARAGDLETLRRSNCHSYAALVKRSVYERVGGYNVFMNPSWEDWEFWLRCAKHGMKWLHVPYPLHIYQRNPDGRDQEAQGKDRLLWGKMQGFHQDVFGSGKGLVCFVVPCYKHEKFVEEAVNSALTQTYPHIKVVCIDDASPTGGLLETELAAHLETGSVSILRHRVNSGLSAARNTGIEFGLSLGAEYFVMLDADDRVRPDFVEKTLAAMTEPNEYIYTDVEFIGDAPPNTFMEMPNYDCKLVGRKHMHACTVLAPAALMRRLRTSKDRGYVYDPSKTMRVGFEDLEWAVAAAQYGFCARRLPERLFQYRQHARGSMRTGALPRSKELYDYIRTKHMWLGGPNNMPCGGCGGGKNWQKLGGNNMKVGNKEVNPNDEIMLRYTGSTATTLTKVGFGGRTYKYSANEKARYGPKFKILARDLHLFRGPYEVTVEEDTVEPIPVAAATGSDQQLLAWSTVQVEGVRPGIGVPTVYPAGTTPAMNEVIINEVKVEGDTGELSLAEALARAQAANPENALPVSSERAAAEGVTDFSVGSTAPNLDTIPLEPVATVEATEPAAPGLTDIEGVGPATEEKLVAAGYSTVESVAKANPEDLASDTGITLKTAQALVQSAQGLL